MDYSVFCQGLLEPRRERLGDVRDALADGDGPGAVWRAFVGDEPWRRFLHFVACPRCRGGGTVGGYDSDMEWEENAWTCAECRATGVRPGSPVDGIPDERHAVALASAPEAVRRAEELAWRFAAELEPWGVPSPERLVWRVGGRVHRPGMPHELGFALWELFSRHWAEELAGFRDGLGITLPGDTRDSCYFDAHWQAEMHAGWETAARLGLRVPDEIMVLGRPVAFAAGGASFGDLANPYTSLLEIWRVGFALDDVAEGVVSLYARPPR
ncbi:hypothetical protein ACSNOI_12890 [Actinomadura kijaniata]|uniref:hypothetical protein n=1 Tax=Actinomadura kijaniata TaxID=46161 RepID=UPI003F1D1D68